MSTTSSDKSCLILSGPLIGSTWNNSSLFMAKSFCSLEAAQRQDLLVGEEDDQEEVSTEWVSLVLFSMEDVLGPWVLATMQTGIAMR